MAYAGPCVPKMASSRVCITTLPGPVSLLFQSNTCEENAGYLATVAYHHKQQLLI